MNLVSDATKLAVNSIEPATIANHGYLHQLKSTSDGAKHDEFTCPFCGNGCGEDGTGITAKQGSDGHYGYFCHRCGEKFDNVQIIAIRHGLDSQRDFRDVVKIACDEFGIYFDDDEEDSVKRSVKKSTLPAQIQPPQKSETDKIRDEKKLKLIRDDLNTDPAPLKEKFPQWRGLPADFLIKYGCRFIEKWTPPDSRADNKFSTPTPRMIIPAGNGYLARLTCSVEDFPEKARPYIKEKQHAGKKALFNPDALGEEIVFAVEGEVDVMSIEFVGFHAVATGGAGSYDLLVDVVKNLQKNPRLIVILFDGDKTGRDSAAKLHAALNQIACPSVVKFLAGDDDSKIDANDFLRGGDGDSLKEILQKFIDDAMKEAAAFEEKISFQKPFDDELRRFYFFGGTSDLTNARRIERFADGRLKFLTDDEIWLTWQDSGFWCKGSKENHCVLPLAFKLSDKLKAEFVAFEKKLNAQKKTIEASIESGEQSTKEEATRLKKIEENRKNAAAVSTAFKSKSKVSNAISLLKGCDSIRITSDDLDRHKNLLNVQNGVVDLQTGKLYRHDPKYLITQQCRAAYDPNARSPLIEKFLVDIMPDEATRAALIRWLAYCLTAETCEEKFMVLLGKGANGKSTLTRVLSTLLGDYAAQIPRDALVVHRFSPANSHTAALNPLANARFATSEELPQSAMIDSSLVKSLTGSDLMPLRGLHQEYKTFRPTAKVNLSSNFTPKFENASDKGLIRRLLVAPFLQEFLGKECDPRLKEKLLQPENQRALLALLVDDAQEWYRNGLLISDAMTKATKENLDASDFVADFLNEFTETGDYETPRRELLDKLKEKYPQARDFNDRDLCQIIERHDVAYKRKKFGFVFVGVRLLTDRDFDGSIVDETVIPPDC